ncbi:Lrp/AsnC family transcriptional regulator [Marinibactrum halimedae]|nr:Lrp/AsnC family transcriptional regulator [Marinibactrum halimedae]MCD9459950.1 Lrp/AsnC family transcriptional regulator [Marinibactrum halimedae]
MDRCDKAIIDSLQRDGKLTNQELATRVNLSPAPCLRRVKRLEKEGVIKGYTCLVNRVALGAHLLAFVQVSLNRHTIDATELFNEFVERCEQVIECYSTSGEYDYLLKVVAHDMVEMEDFLLHELMAMNVISTANTNFVLGERKHTTVIPDLRRKK